MADKRNERTEYNWSWSGDDAHNYRSKYTKGFDPDYMKHAAERMEEQAQASDKSEEQAVRRRQKPRPSVRRARLSAEQEVRTGRNPQTGYDPQTGHDQKNRAGDLGSSRRPRFSPEDNDWEDSAQNTVRDRQPQKKTQSTARRTRQTSAAKERTQSASQRTRQTSAAQERARSVASTRPRETSAAQERARSAAFPRNRQTSAAQERTRSAASTRTRQTAGRDRNRRIQTGNTGARTAAGTRRNQSAAYRRQLVRRRYLFLGIAAVAGLFLILFFANTYTLKITLTGDDPLYLELGETYQDPGATAVYKGSLLHFGDTEVAVVSEHEINNRVCGTYEVTYRAEHKGQEATAKRMVIIPDRTAPVITLDESVNVVRKGEEWKDSFTATDDQDGDITANVEILGEVNMRRDGKYELTYRVQDSAGNETTANRTVIVSSVAINRPETARQGDKNVIYLTFDDGPGMYTERLLEILDSHNVKATFFVTDTNPGSRDLIGEEFRRGHTIGVHSTTHNYDIIYENGEAFWTDLDQEMEIIKEQTGTEPTIMRFPGGSSNDMIAMDDELRRELRTGLRTRGLKYYDWTIDSYDSDDDNTSDDVYWAMVDQTTVAEPKMVLCHDLKRTTIDAIDSYLSWAIENHYVFLPITEETPEVHHEEL